MAGSSPEQFSWKGICYGSCHIIYFGVSECMDVHICAAALICLAVSTALVDS